MSKKTVFVSAILLIAVVLTALYFVQLGNSEFVSPETAEYISLSEGKSKEEAAFIRGLCEANGCYFGNNGDILVNTR